MATLKKKKSKFIGDIVAKNLKKSDVELYGKKQIADLRPIDMARIYSGLQINDRNPVECGELGFSTRALVQANLPHNDPGRDTPIWIRRNGDFSLSIQSYLDENPKTGKRKYIGIPYGNIPRLILFYLCSEAKRTKSRQINLGNNLHDFLYELGMPSNGGEKGYIPRVKKQVDRLFTSTIKFDYKTEGMRDHFNATIAKRYFVFWDKNPKQPSLFNSDVFLDADFFQEISSHPVPIDLGVIAALKSSPLRLDLYTWLTYRVFHLEKDIKIKWTDLAKQVGSEYKQTKYFAEHAREALSAVKSVWHKLKYEPVYGGFILRPSKSSVPKKHLTK